MSGQSFVPPREQLSIFNAAFFQPCIVEYIGITGSTGERGPTGFGFTGEKGDTGASITGPSGLSLTGPVGVSVTGPSGDAGVGLTGAQGATGVGLTGPVGLSGVTQLTLILSTGIDANSTVFNNVFSSTYDAYRVNMTNFSSNNSTPNDIRWGFTASGVRDTTNNYLNRGFFVYGTSAGQFGPSIQTSTSFYVGTTDNTKTALTMDIQNPAITIPAMWEYKTFMANTGNTYMWYGGGLHNVNSAFDGFEFFGSGNNIQASCQIYGYNK